MTSSLPRIRFGPFLFDSQSGELWRDDEPIKLQPQPAKLLALLVERAGRVVSRDDIQRHIWGDAAVDAESGVNFAIRRVREALGETAGESRYVETLPRLGYRFSGDAEFVANPAPVTPSDSEQGGRLSWLAEVRVAARRPGLFLGTVMALVTVVGLSAASVVHRVMDVGHDKQVSSAVSSGARDLFLQGQYLLRTRRPEAVARSASFFRQVLLADPEFAEAYVYLEAAERYVLSLDERQELLRQALELDPNLAIAHLGRGWLEMRRRRPEMARDAFETARRLDLDLVEALHGSALAHAAVGELDASIERLETALHLDPGATLIHGDAFLIYFWADLPVQAVAHMEDMLRLEPGARDLRWIAVSYLAMSGRWHLAAETTETLWPEGMGLEPRPATVGREHWRRQVLRFWEAAIEHLPAEQHETRWAGHIAEALIGLGRMDEAMHYLERAADEGWYGATFLGVDPRWDALRDGDRFQQLLADLGLESYR